MVFTRYTPENEHDNGKPAMKEDVSPPKKWGDFPFIYTPWLPETNIAPENMPSQKETRLQIIHFQVLC